MLGEQKLFSYLFWKGRKERYFFPAQNEQTIAVIMLVPWCISDIEASN